jgi:hypothetical protein
MDMWSVSLYGDPCRECGYFWNWTLEEVVDFMGSLPEVFRDTIGDASGSECHPDLTWSVTGYVCHVADNLRIWAERLEGVVRGSTRQVAPYDESLLAEVRHYDAIDLQAALWTLTNAANDWCISLLEAAGLEDAGKRVILFHPERGELTLVEVARANTHDAVHHQWDVRRITDYNGSIGKGVTRPASEQR